MTALVAAASLPMGAAAQQRSDAWQWDALIYGWFPEIGGQTKFSAPSGGSLSLDTSQILDSLKFTFMGTLAAQKGQWGFFTDVIYFDLGGTKNDGRDLTINGSLPANVTSGVSLDLKSTIWTTAANYRLSHDPASTMDVFFGVRYLDLEQSMNWQFTGAVDSIPLVDRSGYQSASLKNWDGIIGIKGRASFGEGNRWYVPWYVDVGTGDSDLTWQGLIGLGYKFGSWDLFGVYRYLDYKFKSDNKLQDLDAGGFAIGVGFRW